MADRVCGVCGERFSPHSRSQLYCSDDCRLQRPAGSRASEHTRLVHIEERRMWQRIAEIRTHMQAWRVTPQ